MQQCLLVCQTIERQNERKNKKKQKRRYSTCTWIETERKHRNTVGTTIIICMILAFKKKHKHTHIPKKFTRLYLHILLLVEKSLCSWMLFFLVLIAILHSILLPYLCESFLAPSLSVRLCQCIILQFLDYFFFFCNHVLVSV